MRIATAAVDGPCSNPNSLEVSRPAPSTIPKDTSAQKQNVTLSGCEPEANQTPASTHVQAGDVKPSTFGPPWTKTGPRPCARFFAYVKKMFASSMPILGKWSFQPTTITPTIQKAIVRIQGMCLRSGMGESRSQPVSIHHLLGYGTQDDHPELRGIACPPAPWGFASSQPTGYSVRVTTRTCVTSLIAAVFVGGCTYWPKPETSAEQPPEPSEYPSPMYNPKQPFI